MDGIESSQETGAMVAMMIQVITSQGHLVEDHLGESNFVSEKNTGHCEGELVWKICRKKRYKVC